MLFYLEYIQFIETGHFFALQIFGDFGSICDFNRLALQEFQPDNRWSLFNARWLGRDNRQLYIEFHIAKTNKHREMIEMKGFEIAKKLQIPLLGAQLVRETIVDETFFQRIEDFINKVPLDSWERFINPLLMSYSDERIEQAAEERLNWLLNA